MRKRGRTGELHDAEGGALGASLFLAGCKFLGGRVADFHEGEAATREHREAASPGIRLQELLNGREVEAAMSDGCTHPDE